MAAGTSCGSPVRTPAWPEDAYPEGFETSDFESTYSRQPPSAVISGWVLAVASSKSMPGTTRPVVQLDRPAVQPGWFASTTRSSVSIGMA